MAEAPVAALRGVVVCYPGRPPIGPLDIAIAAGEIVALVGASGAGKSTALRLLAGLEQPSEGAFATAPGHTGFVFQNATLMPWADTLTNVALPLELAGTPQPEARRKAADALDAVGLGDRLNARPTQLSGGMAMRVSLARALVTAPDLLLLDEPFAALDSITRRALIEDIHRLWSLRRAAVVFVTHDVEEAVYLAQRVVLLDAATGRVGAEMPTPGVLPRPDRWRTDPDYLSSVETLAAELAANMVPFPLADGGRAGAGGESLSDRPQADIASTASPLHNIQPVPTAFTPIPTLPPSRGKGS